jgi:hypothetical protein
MKVLLALLLLALVFNAAGCSKLFAPSNDDILKAINDSETFKSSGFTVTSPIAIVEKEGKRDDGSWPVKVRFKLSFMYTKDGVATPRESETTTTVYISKSKDASGKTVWVAKLN